MAYRPHPRRARVNSSSPDAWYTSDRSGFISNRSRMAYQWDWSGNTMINKGIIVDVRELDKPQEQLRNLVLPPDPRPVLNARIEPYAIDEAGPASTSLIVAASAGNTTLHVQSVSGFTVSHEIYVYLDNGGFALATIQSIDTVANTLGILPKMPSSAAVQKIVCATGANDII